MYVHAMCMYMYVYVCICMYLYVYVCICIYVQLMSVYSFAEIWCYCQRAQASLQMQQIDPGTCDLR